MADPLELLSHPDNHRDPYPVYDRLRRDAPVVRAQDGTWLVTRYDDVVHVLGDTRLSNDPRHLDSARSAPADAYAEYDRLMVAHRDSPDHERVRHVLAGVMKPHEIRRWNARASAIVVEHFERILEIGDADIVRDLARPLPREVIAEIVGIPRSIRADLWDQAEVLVDQIEPAVDRSRAHRLLAGDAAAAFHDHLHELVRDPTGFDGDTLLGRVTSATRAGVISEAEAVTNTMMMLTAGSETLTNAIAMAVLALLRYPAQFDLLQSDCGRAANAVQEVLRHDAPVQIAHRVVPEPLEVRGRTLATGEMVLAMLGSANRDASQFDNPDQFDITRPNASEHLTSGSGAHHCLGTALAYFELEELIRLLATRVSTITPRCDVSDIEFGPPLEFRGPGTLPVTMTPF